MKYLAVLAVFLTGCVQPDNIPTQNSDANPLFNVIRATVDEENLGDLTLFCIDGVKYVAIPGIGLSVKFKQRYGTFGDPIPETCINVPKK